MQPALLPPSHKPPSPVALLQPPAIGTPPLSSWQPVLRSLQDFRATPRASEQARVGIVLMCRGATARTLASFIDYHLFIGFETILLFLDDPQEGPLLELGRYATDKLHVHLCDSDFWRARLACSRIVARRAEQRVFDDVARTWEWEVQCAVAEEFA